MCVCTLCNDSTCVTLSESLFLLCACFCFCDSYITPCSSACVSCQIETVICFFHVAVSSVSLLPSIQTLWQISSTLQEQCVDVFGAFLLCRSDGLCCDTSDSLTEQLSGLLTICLSFGWVTDLWTAEWLASLQTGWQADWLSALLTEWLTGCKSDWLAESLTDWLRLRDWL